MEKKNTLQTQPSSFDWLLQSLSLLPRVRPLWWLIDSPIKIISSLSPVFCRVYTPDHSYVTIRSRLSCRVGEILALVREKLQYSEEQPVLPGHLLLVAVTSAGGQSL